MWFIIPLALFKAEHIRNALCATSSVNSISTHILTRHSLPPSLSTSRPHPPPSSLSFNDFLMDLKQSKRKNIRQERKKVGNHSFTALAVLYYSILFHLLLLSVASGATFHLLHLLAHLCFTILSACPSQVVAQGLTLSRLRGNDIKVTCTDMLSSARLALQWRR